MPFQQQISSQLTQNQSNVLGKLKSYSNYNQFIPKSDLFIPLSRQVSLFDYIKQLFNSIGGAQAFENLLKTFLSKLFDLTNNYLEVKVVNAIAASLNAKNITIAQGATNQEWLNQYVLPGFNLAKDKILDLLLSFIFGPSQLMSNSMSKTGAPTQSPQSLLEMASCGQMLYSVSNLPDEGVGDIEYNKAQLQNQLSTGGVSFNISCQQVVIQMPQHVLDGIVSGTTATISGSRPSFNPSYSINALDSWVQSEVSRQNVPENKSSASKTFFESLIEKLLSLISTIVKPFLDPISVAINSIGNPFQTLIDKLGNKTQVPMPVTTDIIAPSACDVYNEGIKKMSGKQSDDSTMAFLKYLLNAVLGLLLSILLSELIKQVKKLLMNVVAKKAEDLAQRLIKARLAEYEDFFGAVSAEEQKLLKLEKALSHLIPILKSIIP